MPQTIKEARVVELWQSAIRQRTDLVTEDNVPVRVVYPGRPNDDRGADLRDAVIDTGQRLITGDIEIHVKSSAWWAHGHHQDPAYNPVILHVVYRHDAGRQTVLQNGTEVPTLALARYAGENQRREVIASPSLSPNSIDGCRDRGYSRPDDTARVLDAAGDTRFLARAAGFQREIAAAGRGQALYRGIMTALGYSKNKDTMARLAGCLPLRELEEITSGRETDDACLIRVQAGLLGTAGLLPSQRPAQSPAGYYAGEYEKLLEQSWNNSCGTARMSAGEWRFFKVRPGNFPVRRIAAMGCLLVRFRKPGLLKGLQAILEDAPEDNGSALQAVLLVGADGYWQRYMDFTWQAKRSLPALLGEERAADITVNAVLPFFAIQPGLKEKAWKIFRGSRAPAENSLEKHMRRQLGLTPDMCAAARRRQGLLHIYKTLCTQGKCRECPLGR